MQRLHQDDLTDHLLSTGPWELLKIQAYAKEDIIYEKKNTFIFKKDSLLNNERDSEDYINKLKSRTNASVFAAQYMQEPLPQNFNLLRKEELTYWRELPSRFDYYLPSRDTAIKTNENANFSVGATFGIYEKKMYLVNLYRKKMSYPELKITTEQLAKRFMPKYILIEDKASGQSLLQDLKQFLVMNNDSYAKLVPIKPKLDKLTRFAASIPLFTSGMILIPEKASYLEILLDEITEFPNSRNDDIVDALSQALNYYKNNLMNQAKARLRCL